ncbi:2-oxo-4-hydroxy-4-carboxy-5-ureidoimidazoline decarboxylase [Roseibium denhamense]|uniref:2-oxo-4-hydroxy-4-carboxy-5-ureidoimidazoline decarboxylase n=1 Tax=Roseibium denhamense TaxID=76305 RepID=A0ABY1NPX3_9HYPH|nr:2-oxo-4-hydroxy-4-carboxy-5-ureidoimidazoline decarboxylase [Roseibium denhamense]MTI07950.1 2-oxo-4-hydroxy-4-carboxy-5-ureidoimidazoline decarboxylase [Roseibium denhamense]SMP15131.1 2-oxo-4-hydroxy-4-carboxy-5-ureidoimidazoline decarboxylase [Roseibium denhamense]
MITVDEINALNLSDFLAAFGDVAEHSPWVAEKAFEKRPFVSREDVISAFERAMLTAGKDKQIALIRAHPDLAGKAALAGEMAEDSKKEQAGAGLDTLTKPEFEQFTTLNDRYRHTFGFPFIFAVKGATKHMILEAFEARIGSDPETEFQTALSQIARIFRFRLEDRIQA